MAIEVRRATKSDADAIAGFAMRLVEQHRNYDPVRFARLGDLKGMAWFYGSQTEANDAAVIVVEADGRLAGFAYLGFEVRNYADLAESAARLHDIYVDAPARHQGAGKELIAAAIEAARAFGASKLLLSVAAANTVAQKFFDRAGFRTTMLEKMLVLEDENAAGE